MAGVTVKITDKRATKDWKKVFGKKGASVKVGILDNKGGSAQASDSTITVSELAAIHEFGLGRVPERSFIRSYFDLASQELIGMASKLMAQAIANVAKTGVPMSEATQHAILSKLGMYASGKIKERIGKGEIEPELDPKTIAKKTRNGKAGNIPLIDTGQLRSSITYEVEIK